MYACGGRAGPRPCGQGQPNQAGLGGDRCVDGKSGEAPAASEAELRPDIDRLAVAARVGERLEPVVGLVAHAGRSEEHTSELQSLMRISYAVFCLKKTNQYE